MRGQRDANRRMPVMRQTKRQETAEEAIIEPTDRSIARDEDRRQRHRQQPKLDAEAGDLEEVAGREKFGATSANSSASAAMAAQGSCYAVAVRP
jgi:hypothetical protein